MTQEYYQQRLDGQNVCAISSKGHGIKMCHSFFSIFLQNTLQRIQRILMFNQKQRITVPDGLVNIVV